MSQGLRMHSHLTMVLLFALTPACDSEVAPRSLLAPGS